MSSKICTPQFRQKEKKLNENIKQWRLEDKSLKYDVDGTQVGDSYLKNKGTIDRTKMYRLAVKAPKGGHLHIHYNSCLQPNVLLDIAKEDQVNEMMYISLPNLKGPLKDKKQLKTANVKFHFMATPDVENLHSSVLINDSVFAQDFNKLTEKKKPMVFKRLLKEKEKAVEDKQKLIETTRPTEEKNKLMKEKKTLIEEVNWLTEELERRTAEKKKPTAEKKKCTQPEIKLDERMLFWKFRSLFTSEFPGENAMKWLEGKLVFSADEVNYPADKKGNDETCKAQWVIFDTRTQMMAGLFNNEHAYREYTRKLLTSFRQENIQYAEIRPNFMPKNQVYRRAKPTELMDNFGIMDIIIDEYNKFQQRLKDNGKPAFGGLKVIYCTPRSFAKHQIKFALDECLKMKKNPEYTNYIAGFDVIGPEARGKALSYFKDEFNAFKKQCADANVRCPFLFHAGESHHDPDCNLETALELGARRIAHGYAIPTKRLRGGQGTVLDKCKEAKKLCIECCPISNEILGLHPYARDAVVYKLMENGIACALASDNPTLFSSTLSHDFYQFMIGKEDFKVEDWRKLMEDSLEHAVWNSPEEKNFVRVQWENKYYEFVTGASGDPGFLDAQKPKPSGPGPNPAAPGPKPTGPGPKPTGPGPKPTGSGPKPAGDAASQRNTSQQATRPESPAPQKRTQANSGPNVSKPVASRTASGTVVAPTARKVSGQAPTATATGTVGTPGPKKVNNSTSTATAGTPVRRQASGDASAAASGQPRRVAGN